MIQACHSRLPFITKSFRRRSASCRVTVVTALVALLAVSTARAEPPVLYAQPYHESPVHGAPDELLLLGGHGFAPTDEVVYALVEGDALPNRPAHPPQTATPESGVAPVVSGSGVPHSLVVHLPDTMLRGREYALWVRTAQGEWSEPVRINDPRPLWLTPARVSASGSPAGGLARYLKVVGRNLDPAPDATTRVRLSGPEELILPAETLRPALDRHVARVSLPRLSPGAYRVAVSRDGMRWAEVANQTLEVRPDATAAREFLVSEAAPGGCRADDGRDDTECIMRALDAARAAGGGRVVLGAGVWDLADAAVSASIVIPTGVDLVGAGAASTALVRHPAPRRSTAAALTLEGRNTLSGLTFRDVRRYERNGEAGPFLQIGSGAGGSAVEDVVIAANVFDRTMIGIADSAVPIERLVVAYNEFGAFSEAIRLVGNRFDALHRFRVEDSIVAHNVFKPGSFLDADAFSGAIASELGGTYRLDFSHNVADGAATDYLYAPASDARGWRAGFFWHMNENNEMLLVSDNTATCTGDKIGDGEAIAYDNNGNTFGLDAAAPVLRAGRSEVTIALPLRTAQHGREIELRSYYVGHWIQVGTGPGLGQVRKIEAYTVDARKGEVTFTISPAWDVVPEPSATHVSIGRTFWQVYTLANTIDHARPPCLKSNRTNRGGGAIAVWAQTADSVVAGNHLRDTNGILFQNLYSELRPGSRCGADCDRGTHYMSFVDIRDNTISGESAPDDACSSSGIIGSLGAGPDGPPRTTGYGVSIAHNRISNADARNGGAISFSAGWHVGPAPYRWPLVANTLIQHNRIEGLSGRALRPCAGDRSAPRTGIHLGNASLLTGTVLHANTCGSMTRPLAIGGARETVRYCAGARAGDCGCTSPASRERR